MKKVIQILCHTLNGEDKNFNYHISGNWATRASKSILKYSNDYTCEVWYGVRKLNKKKVFQQDGITYKLFPARTLYGLLESFFAIIYCPSMIEELKNIDPDTTVIHFQGERGSLIHQILYLFPDYTYSIQYHGYGQPESFDWLEKYFLAPIERLTFPHIDRFFVHIKRRFPYLTDTIGIQQEKLSYQNYGVDYERFSPGSKSLARRKLGIPQNAFVLVYTGLMTQTKGVDKILEAYTILKKKYPHIYLLLIGAQKTDPLYREVHDIADRVEGITKNEDLPQYYRASDVYVFFGTKKTIEYAGTGVAPNEAIACNINVISTNIIHFPKSIQKKVGLCPKDFTEFVTQIEYLITHPEKKFNARNVIESYASDEVKTKNIIKIYDSLLSKRATA